MYIVSALLFLVVAGLMATVMRIQLALPNNHFVDPRTFNRLFTMHGTTMVFLVGMPILAGFANYLVPLMIGARDMAFPRLNAFGFWIFLFGGLLLYFSYLGGDGLVRRGFRTRRRLVRLCAADRPRFLARIQHRLLDPGHPAHRNWQHRQCPQRDCHDALDARSRHDPGAHAAVRLDDVR